MISYQSYLFCEILLSQILSLININFIILKFGGDKGGKALKIKFGVTIMNTPLSNSVDAFDLVAALESEDFYTNLNTGIFEYYKTKLSVFFMIVSHFNMYGNGLWKLPDLLLYL